MATPMHIHEDLSKPENRTNLALFSILMIPEVHEFMCQELMLPNTVIIMPSENLHSEEITSNLRPDYKIVGALSEPDPLGYIEVELGAEDQTQMAIYRSKTDKAVYSIVGRKEYRHRNGNDSLSLEEIYDLAEQLKNSYRDSQQQACLELFCSLVKHYVIDGHFPHSNKRVDLSDEMARSTLIRQVYEYFGSDRILRNTNIERGKILLNSVGPSGFSLRVYCTESRNHEFSLMSRSAGRKETEFPSLEKLLKYFPFDADAAHDFARVIGKLGAREISGLPEGRRAKLPIGVVEDHFTEIGGAIERFL
jgi:hypothetical protein